MDGLPPFSAATILRTLDVTEPAEILNDRTQPRAWLAMWAGIAIVTLLAIHRLRDFPYQLSWIAAWTGIRSVLGQTLWAAIKVWIFWGWSSLVIAGFALRIEPEMEVFDSILLGAAGVWVFAFLLGNLLGPIGLFNGPTIWGLLLLGTAWLWRNPPSFDVSPSSSGQKLAALAVVLLAVSYLPLQLGSPIVPFMDVLSYPASAQRILSFGVYQPFNNDPYGCWGPYAQTPALELFYAMLGMGSHVSLAALAESAAMMPMAALLIFATWRLGKSLFDDTAGGVAALFLFFTVIFRRAQGMRGTAVDFVLVALGLAFFMHRRSRALFVAGALMLGTAVVSHALDGAFAMIVAGFGILLWLAEGDYRRFAAGVLALAGALLVAAPVLLIGLQHPMPYPILPLLQLSGIAAIIVAAQWAVGETRADGSGTLAVLNRAAVTVFVLAVLYRHATTKYTFYEQIAGNLPMLTLFCFGGLIAAIAAPSGIARFQYFALAGIALLLGVAGEYLDPILRALSHSPTAGMMASDVGIKLWDYWCPYFLTLPAGYLFAIAYDRWSRPATLFILLTLLIYPWHQIPNPIDYDSVEHSITEQWAFNLHTAALGYWAGHTDRRWTFTPEEMNLVKVLEDEISAGRITMATHILHICQSISVWSMQQFSVLTGINDDPIEYQHDPNNLWEGGSRVRGMNQISEALSAAPDYILTQVPPPVWFGDPPPGYQKIYDALPTRLYRRNGIGDQPVAPRRSAVYSWTPGIIAMVAALLLFFGDRISAAKTARDAHGLSAPLPHGDKS